MSTAPRRARPSARILLIDPADRVLLFRFTPGDGRPDFWCTPGGALDPGEGYAEACARELAEETGHVLPIGPEVWQKSIAFVTIEGEPVTSDERYFLIRAPDAVVSTAGHTELERRVMQSHAWLDRAGLAALAEPYYPEDLAEMLAALGIW